MVTNLQRYAIGDGNKLFDVGCAEVIGTPTGMWCKFEEAVEASSNSLQQLKAEIAAILVRYDLMTSNPYCEVPKGLRIDMETLRQLSAV